MGDVLPPGTRLGRYEIVQRLALGGMAEIYLARMSGLAGFAKHVVLKRILPSHARDAEFVRMFFNEARYAATLDHPNIAHVYDLGEEQGLHYFTMEYLHGEDCRTLLRELVTRGLTLPMEHALTIVVGAAAGCHFAHEMLGDDGKPLGLIHRDVSPSNVVVTYAGAVKLVDFGIAKATNLEDVTAIGVTKGKLAYMAPEQCRGESLDRRVDVYALGVLLYELTTQRRAFAGQNDANVMWAVISGEVPPPSSHVPGYPPALAAIIARAMHKDRMHRFATARELSQAIEGYARDAGLTLNPAALGEFLERTMGPKLEPWKDPGRVKTTPLPGSLAGTSPMPSKVEADAPTYASPATGPRKSTAPSTEAETAAEMAVTTPRARPSTTADSVSRGDGAKPRSPWPVLGAATLGAAALIGGTLYWRETRRPSVPGEPIVVVAERGTASIERDGGPGVEPAGDPIDAAVAEPPATDAAVAEPRVDAGVRKPPPPPPDPLSAAFKKREPLVNKCFKTHADVVIQHDSITLRFEIDAAGVPTKVEVLPADVGRTAVGACIADIGRGTRFPKQDAPTAFRIPVQIRTDGGGT